MSHSFSRRRGRALPLPAPQRAAADADSSTGHLFDDVGPDPNGSGSTRDRFELLFWSITHATRKLERPMISLGAPACSGTFEDEAAAKLTRGRMALMVSTVSCAQGLARSYKDRKGTRCGT